MKYFPNAHACTRNADLLTNFGGRDHCTVCGSFSLVKYLNDNVASLNDCIAVQDL